MNREGAIKIAEEYVNHSANDCSLVYEKIIEFDYGYCFIWNSNAYIKSRDINDMLIGPGPIIVPKDGSNIYCLGNAYSSASLIRKFTNQYEEENGSYSLWIEGRLNNSSTIRQKYNISLTDLKNAMNSLSPLLCGSKYRLENELIFIKNLGNKIKLKRTQRGDTSCSWARR